MSWNPFSRSAKPASPAQVSSSANLGAANSPSSYAQWSECLDELRGGNNDEACLARLNSGALSWSGGVAPKFVERINDEINRRLDICSKRLTRDLQLGAQETTIVRAIVQARHQLDFVHRLCHLSALPETTRQQLAGEVAKFAQRAQSSLQDSAKADRSGRLEGLFRNNPLTRYVSADQPRLAESTSDPAAVGGRPTKRNILL